MTTATKPIWEGAKALRRCLVPISDLEPFPGNPRLGDIEAVRASLRRFGQVRAILVDGNRIVGGHHVVLAGEAEGWTHIAAIANEFRDEEEARAYLLADNRIPELGGYDEQLLVQHLQQLAELDALDGTGYTYDDLDEHLARLAQLGQEPAPPPLADPTDPGVGDVSEMVLMYSKAQREQVEIWLQIVAKEKGTDGVSETTYEALRVAAQLLNG